jgi:hypothetical protein
MDRKICPSCPASLACATDNVTFHHHNGESLPFLLIERENSGGDRSSFRYEGDYVAVRSGGEVVTFLVGKEEIQECPRAGEFEDFVRAAETIGIIPKK